MSRRSPTSVGAPNVAGPRLPPPREIYTGDDLLRAPVRPGAQDAFRLPSLVAGKAVKPEQLHADLRAPIAAAPPPFSRAASRVADAAPPPLPEPPAAPPSAAEPVQPPPVVTRTRAPGVDIDAAHRRTDRQPTTDTLALTLADLARTLENTAQLLHQAARVLISNPQALGGQ